MDPAETVTQLYATASWYMVPAVSVMLAASTRSLARRAGPLPAALRGVLAVLAIFHWRLGNAVPTALLLAAAAVMAATYARRGRLSGAVAAAAVSAPILSLHAEVLSVAVLGAVLLAVAVSLLVLASTALWEWIFVDEGAWLDFEEYVYGLLLLLAGSAVLWV